MTSSGNKQSLWRRLLGRRNHPPAEPEVDPTEAAGEIKVSEEKRKFLEEAIPFHRPPEPGSAPAAPLMAPFESFANGNSDPARGVAAPDPEPYRKKYKKYGRDVCLESEADSYDVVMDNKDSSHHNVDKVSPL